MSEETPKPFPGNFVVVLVRPKGAGNVGSIARTMSYFGIRGLRLVAPRCDVKSLEARSMAMGGQPILGGAEHFASLRDATADCVWLVATSRRLSAKHSPTLAPREGAPLLFRRAEKGRVALVFGSEDKGLRLDEMALCPERMQIPGVAGKDSFNLSQAVLLILWELFMSRSSLPEGAIALEAEPPPGRIPAAREAVEGFLDHLLEIFEKIHFLPHHDPERVRRTFRGIVDRAAPDAREVRMLRGVLHQIEWTLFERARKFPSGEEAAPDASAADTARERPSSADAVPPAAGEGNILREIPRGR